MPKVILPTTPPSTYFLSAGFRQVSARFPPGSAGFRQVSPGFGRFPAGFRQPRASARLARKPSGLRQVLIPRFLPSPRRLQRKTRHN